MYEVLNIEAVEVSPVVAEPVDLDEVKEWLKIEVANDDFDNELSNMITGARQSLEAFLNIKLVPHTVTLYVDTAYSEQMVKLPYGRFTSLVVSSSYIDEADNQVLTLGDDYYTRGNNLIPLDYGAYKITYTVGGSTVPEALKEAIKMEVAQRFLNKGENLDNSGLSTAAQAKAYPYMDPVL